LRNGVSFSGTVNLLKDTTEVRLVARDAGNGSIGTVNISVTNLFAPVNRAVPTKK
jgi:hypothetical protein